MRNQAIVKHVSGEARFTFSFLYNHLKSGAVSAGQDGKPGRQFNMNRGLDEPFDQFTARVQVEYLDSNLTLSSIFSGKNI